MGLDRCCDGASTVGVGVVTDGFGDLQCLAAQHRHQQHRFGQRRRCEQAQEASLQVLAVRAGQVQAQVVHVVRPANARPVGFLGDDQQLALLGDGAEYPGRAQVAAQDTQPTGLRFEVDIAGHGGGQSEVTSAEQQEAVVSQPFQHLGHEGGIGMRRVLGLLGGRNQPIVHRLLIGGGRVEIVQAGVQGPHQVRLGVLG